MRIHVLLPFRRVLLAVLPLVLLLARPAAAQWVPSNPVQSVERQPNGVLLAMKTGKLRLEVCSPSIVHVIYTPTAAFPDFRSYGIARTQWPAAAFQLASSDPKSVTLTTSALQVAVDRATGAISYLTAAGQPLTEEASRVMRPAIVNGENTYHSESFFSIYGSREGFYGLGQHQAGVWNYHGAEIDLSQENTEIAIPFVLSSKGYGIFWNNDSRSKFNNRFVHALYFSSEVANSIDYYFFYGPQFDRLVADYRELTGRVPMFGEWAYGFWQSKNKYQTQKELLGVAEKYRRLHIPVDNIVQDWFWWKVMGDFQWNAGYPDPKAMIAQLHRNHFHLMVSVWPYFEKGSPQYTYMDRKGWFLDRTIVPSFHPVGMALYDATNPAARAYFWKQIDESLFKIGADAWWLDTDEPETEGRQRNQLLDLHLHIGSGARYANVFPLMHAMGVADGQRKASRRQRVFILSRSAFAGSQHYGVTAWSGDVLSDWLSFRRQIPAGLNYSVSGLPYWTTDIGGFFIGNPQSPAYRELYVRWFEYGAFCPIFRTHGTRAPLNSNELWAYGPEAEKILVKFDRLRYRLMPYIYSLAWMTTHDGYTPMRPLVMDFRKDVRAQNVGDQFMYGPALLVNPVTHPDVDWRPLYLPHAQWTDFWTGKPVAGGREIVAPAPLDRIPLYVRAGSILPMGPDMEWTSQKPEDPIELRIYPGADGHFTLYEDQGDGYGYQHGEYATIPLSWNDATHTLTLGARQGRFPGMLATRTFRVVLVGPGHGAGASLSARADRVVRYTGAQETVTLSR